MVVNAIKTDKYPYQVEYIAAMDEVWVLCWGNSTLNVVGVRNVTTEIAKIKDANLLVVKHSIKAQVGSGRILQLKSICCLGETFFWIGSKRDHFRKFPNGFRSVGSNKSERLTHYGLDMDPLGSDLT